MKMIRWLPLAILMGLLITACSKSEKAAKGKPPSGKQASSPGSGGAAAKNLPPTSRPSKEDGPQLAVELKEAAAIEVVLNFQTGGKPQTIKKPATIKKILELLNPKQSLKGNRTQCGFAHVIYLLDAAGKKRGMVAACQAEAYDWPGAYISFEKKLEWKITIPYGKRLEKSISTYISKDG